MKKSTVSQIITGSAFLLLGLALLGTLIDILQSTSVYSFVMPLVLITSGYAMLDETKVKQRRNTGFGLMAIGLITLLVRYNILRGNVINAVLGIVLAGWGLFILIRLYDKKPITDKPQ